GDPGFYRLAEEATRCQLERKPGDLEARRLLVHLAIQFHRFAEAEKDGKALLAETDNWQDAMFVGDALMEQGRLEEAAGFYQQALDVHPGLAIYDRVGWLRWMTGDLEGAVEEQVLATQAGSPTDPE